MIEMTFSFIAQYCHGNIYLYFYIKLMPDYTKSQVSLTLGSKFIKVEQLFVDFELFSTVLTHSPFRMREAKLNKPRCI